LQAPSEDAAILLSFIENQPLQANFFSFR